MTNTQTKEIELPPFELMRTCPKCTRNADPTFTMRYVLTSADGDNDDTRVASYVAMSRDGVTRSSVSVAGLEEDVEGVIVHECQYCAYTFVTHTADYRHRTTVIDDIRQLARSIEPKGRETVDEKHPLARMMRHEQEAKRWRKLLWFLGAENDLRVLVTSALQRVVGSPARDIRALIDQIDDGKELS